MALPKNPAQSCELEVVAPPPPPTTYCPSVNLMDGGFGFHLSDPPDPLATAVIGPCAGDTSEDSIYIYPTAGAGHTVRVNDCDGVLIGYGANLSICAPNAQCCPEVTVNNQPAVNNFTAPAVTNNFSPTVNNQPAVNNITLPAPTIVSAEFNGQDQLVITDSDGNTYIATPNMTC